MCVGGADAGETIDGGARDGGSTDAGSDTGTVFPDSSTPDSSIPIDVGIDAGMDAGAPDAGTDAAVRDAGPMDAGTDAARRDAGPLMGGLVINEIDYDQVGTDAAEFVEIYNGAASPADLTGLAVVFINGSSSTEYARAPLSGSLASGAFLVVGVSGQTLPTPAGTVRIDISAMGIQNGAPDGVVLWDTARLAAVDALSYEGSLTSVTTVDGATISLVEGTPTTLVDSNTVEESLCRMPDGRDTNDASTDWMICMTPTPGSPN
jgi:hypothetical protein